MKSREIKALINAALRKVNMLWAEGVVYKELEIILLTDFEETCEPDNEFIAYQKHYLAAHDVEQRFNNRRLSQDESGQTKQQTMQAGGLKQACLNIVAYADHVSAKTAASGDVLIYDTETSQYIPTNPNGKRTNSGGF